MTEWLKILAYFEDKFSTLDDYKIYIENLPLEDSPQFFGMDDNAQNAYQVIIEN